MFGLSALSFTLMLPIAQPVKSDDKVNEAIDRGVDYLLAAVEKSQMPGKKEENPNLGQIAMETYALVVAGVSVNHPLIKKNFEYLNERMVKTGYTYGISLYVFALDAAIAQEESDLMLSNMDHVQAARKFKDNPNVGREYRQELTAALNKLVTIRQTAGGWHYTAGGGSFDNSNTQFAVLALGVALKRNVPLDSSVWEKTLDHFVKGQQKPKGEEVTDRLTLMSDTEVADRRLKGTGKKKERVEVDVVKKEADDKSVKAGADSKDDAKDKEKSLTGVARKGLSVGPDPEMPSIGTESIPVFRRGWDYQNKGGATWSMSCAGLSSLLLAREALKGRIPPAQLESVNAAVRDGYGWMMTNWAPTGSGFYGMYSLEKVADIGEVKKFGPHDWYAEVSGGILGMQKADGSWPCADWGENDRLGTSFALLILNRATQLVMMSLLSQNPLSKIVISGKKSTDDPTDRSWVYVPELDTTIHYPTLLRTIRMRAHPKLLKFLKSIVQGYPDEAKGELIPDLARARDEVLQKDARKSIEEYLTDITGFNYKNAEDYMKWFARWEKVRLIGTSQKADRVPDLLKYYDHTQKSVTLKKTIMWALVQCKAGEAIPLFLKDLENPDARVRAAAYNSFRAFFIDFPPAFEPAGSDGARSKQVETLKNWYQEQLKKQ